MSAVNAGRSMLPIDPIRDAVIRDARRLWDSSEVSMYLPEGKYPGLAILANQTRIGERALRRWVDGESQHADENAVDRYCIATDRHLSDLYPELYADPDTEDEYAASCERCPAASLVIIRETKLRLWLRCSQCGAGRYLNHPKSPKSGPPRRFTPEDEAEMRRLYERGLLIRDIAARYGCPYTTAAYSLKRAGTRMRLRTPPPVSVSHNHAWRAFQDRRIAKGYEMSLRCAELRSQGHTMAAIGLAVGLSKAGVKVALDRLERRVEAA